MQQVLLVPENDGKSESEVFARWDSKPEESEATNQPRRPRNLTIKSVTYNLYESELTIVAFSRNCVHDEFQRLSDHP